MLSALARRSEPSGEGSDRQTKGAKEIFSQEAYYHSSRSTSHNVHKNALGIMDMLRQSLPDSGLAAMEATMLIARVLRGRRLAPYVQSIKNISRSYIQFKGHRPRVVELCFGYLNQLVEVGQVCGHA